MITEASPLNFPADATLAEENYDLHMDGTRSRRLGMDYESGFVLASSAYVEGEEQGLAINAFVWENVEENAGQSFAVVQIGNTLYFHDTVNTVLSTAAVGEVEIGVSRTSDFSFASIDGKLIVATGEKDIYKVSFDTSDASFLVETFILKVRDMWGVQDDQFGIDLRDGGNISLRPSGTIGKAHLYNLRNQSWGVQRAIRHGEARGGNPGDPITSSKLADDYGYWPSNADIMHEWVRPDPENDQQAIRYFTKDFKDNPPFNVQAPQGYFIIDALERGQSRENEEIANNTKHPLLNLPLANTSGEILRDYTPNGASVVAEYAGRVFYGGFSGTVIEGDRNSPRLSSYIMYSQLVDKGSDVEKCYQEGDPTSPDSSDLVATDGGVLRISGAGEIINLISIDTSLFVVATNGLWRISGGSDFGFAADNFEVSKVTEHGPTSKDSLVQVEDTIMYWSDDGIYHVSRGEVGVWKADNLTQTTIQTFYDNILNSSKDLVRGVYDQATRKVRWMYPGSCLVNQEPEMTELILDMNLGAFYPFRIVNKATGTYHAIQDYLAFTSTSVEEVPEAIEEGAVEVVVGGDLVVINELVRSRSESALKYLVTHTDTDIKYTFAEYNNEDWLDWDTAIEAESGTDAPASLTTGEIVAGDSSRDKVIPFLTVHMEKARGLEAGYALDCDGTPIPAGLECAPYSCDALETAIIALNPWGYWKMNDDTVGGVPGAGLDPDTVVAATLGTDLLATSGAVTGQYPALLDDCDGKSLRVHTPSGPGSTLTFGTQPTIDNLEFSHWWVTEYTNTFPYNIFVLDYEVIEFPPGANVDFSCSGGSTGVTIDYSSLLSGNISVTIPFAFNIGQSYTQEITTDSLGIHFYVDSVLIGSVLYAVYGDIYQPRVGAAVNAFRSTFNANEQYTQHLLFSETPLTTTQRDDLQLGYDRTFSDYVVPEECESGTLPGDGDGTGWVEIDSSCLVQTGWDFADNELSGRLSRQFQVYTTKRHQDTSYKAVTSRNKIRGRGASFYMTMETEPAKDCKLMGWNLALAGNKYV